MDNIIKTFDEFVERANLIDIVNLQECKDIFKYDRCVFDNWHKKQEVKKINELVKNKNLYIWTLVNGEGQNIVLIKGYSYIDRLGYIFTTNDLQIYKEGIYL